jgi:predicted CxxxxCH...CXXCH cytochrome family protein
LGTGLTLLAFALCGGVPGRMPSGVMADSTPCNCQSCHGDHHGGNWSGCTGCHDSPPATGSHLVHYNSAPETNLPYGDVAVRSTPQAYKFGCGNCHPIDSSKHRNGSVDVELFDASAPAGSIKALNPSSAAFDAGSQTCANVYCHSGKSVTSGAVGLPVTSPPNPVPPGYVLNGPYIMDPSCSSLTYDPFSVTTSRVYATTPAWGAPPSFSTCKECHQFPLTTSFPTVEAGVGDSHQWRDEWGWANLHSYNMSWYSSVGCRTCHYSTVTATAGIRDTYQNGQETIEYDPVPIASHVAHVNGAPDVAFDTVNDVQYRNPVNLGAATYDAASKTCSDVGCHYTPGGARWQKNVKWGMPYRWESSVECDQCHRMGLSQTCQPPTP